VKIRGSGASICRCVVPAVLGDKERERERERERRSTEYLTEEVYRGGSRIGSAVALRRKAFGRRFTADPSETKSITRGNNARPSALDGALGLYFVLWRYIRGRVFMDRVD